MTHVRRRTLYVLIVAALVTSPALAQQTFTSNSIFSKQGLSVWNTGPAFVLDTGSQFLGEKWNVGPVFGGIDSVCVLGICAKAGVEIGANTSGTLGIDYSLKVDSGSFGVLYPLSVTPPAHRPSLS